MLSACVCVCITTTIGEKNKMKNEITKQSIYFSSVGVRKGIETVKERRTAKKRLKSKLVFADLCFEWCVCVRETKEVWAYVSCFVFYLIRRKEKKNANHSTEHCNSPRLNVYVSVYVSEIFVEWKSVEEKEKQSRVTTPSSAEKKERNKTEPTDTYMLVHVD